MAAFAACAISNAVAVDFSALTGYFHVMNLVQAGRSEEVIS